MQTLQDRMKRYEASYKSYMVPNCHNVLRLDGRSFKNYTKQFLKPFDNLLIDTMNYAAKVLCESLQGAVCAYVQSDEISIYFTDTNSHEMQLPFNGEVQKINSICASIVSNAFNKYLLSQYLQSPNFKIENFKFAEFDCRILQFPNIEEMNNHMIWRQNDNKRNSVSSVARHIFSQKSLNGKSTKHQLEMLTEAGHDWNQYSEDKKYGRLINKWYRIDDVVFMEPPSIEVEGLRSYWKVQPAWNFKEKKSYGK